MSNISITRSVPSLPEGWEGSPDELIQWVIENETFEGEGEFLAGQIGGSRPVVDVGLFVNGRRLEVWEEDEYVSIITVPIGCVLPYAGAGITPPDDYLFCDGSLIDREDYPDLFDVIGTTYDSAVDSTEFRLPNILGRYLCGAGLGTYDPDGNGVTGDITEREVGQYFGREWVQKSTPTQPNPPSGRFNVRAVASTGSIYAAILPPTLAMQFIIKAK